MSRNIQDLQPKFAEKAQKLIDNCKEKGVEVRPFFTLRSVFDQAKLWRQSRSAEEVSATIASLNKRGATFLADVIKEVGAQHGLWATNAIPGLSWHNWGLAIDCFVVKDGKAIWSTEDSGYEVYATEAKKLELTAGHYWKKQDSVHVQYPSIEVPVMYTDIKEIDRKMRELFGV